MKGLIITGILAALILGAALGRQNAEAMAKCQETYSFDTCFHILNN